MNRSRYTSIPIPPSDVISRSLHNLSAAAALRRPWPEFLSAVDCPNSLSDALDRVQKNFMRFRVNYAFIVAAGAAISIVGNPLGLAAAAGVVALWLLLYFFREDPPVVSGHPISDRALLIGLVLLTMTAVWLSGSGRNMVIGVGATAAVCGIHGAVINPEGFFLDEKEAASANLIHPNSTS